MPLIMSGSTNWSATNPMPKKRGRKIMCEVMGFNPACTLRNQTLYYLSNKPVASWTALIVGKCKCRSVSRMTWREQLLLSLSLVNKHFFSTPPSFSPFSWFFFSSNFSSFHPKHRKFFFSSWTEPKKKQFARTAKFASSSLKTSFRCNKIKMNWSKMEFSPSHPAAAPQMKTNC